MKQSVYRARRAGYFTRHRSRQSITANEDELISGSWHGRQVHISLRRSRPGVSELSNWICVFIASGMDVRASKTQCAPGSIRFHCLAKRSTMLHAINDRATLNTVWKRRGRGSGRFHRKAELLYGGRGSAYSIIVPESAKRLIACPFRFTPREILLRRSTRR